MITPAVRQVAAALGRSDVLLYTSRTVVAGRDPAGLAIARAVSAALSQIVRETLAAAGSPGRARPAWIVAKGGITSHDVAVYGLGIRRAEVIGQLFPGRDLGVPPAGGGARGDRPPIRGLRRQRRR